ncbi:hypothetical protein D3C81_2044920 [compost metagenome]
MLHNTSSVCARRVGYPYPKFCGSFVVDVVVTCTMARDDSQPGRGGNHLSGQMAASEKNRVYLILNLLVSDCIGAVAESYLA